MPFGASEFMVIVRGEGATSSGGLRVVPSELLQLRVSQAVSLCPHTDERTHAEGTWPSGFGSVSAGRPGITGGFLRRGLRGVSAFAVESKLFSLAMRRKQTMKPEARKRGFAFPLLRGGTADSRAGPRRVRGPKVPLWLAMTQPAPAFNGVHGRQAQPDGGRSRARPTARFQAGG